MKYLNSYLPCLTLVALLWAENGSAQEATALVQRSDRSASYLLALGASIGTAPATIIPMEDPRRTELERQVRRNRRALIGTSVGTAVGFSLWMIATTRGCDGGFSERTDLVCTKSGQAVRTTGIVLFSGGLAGMLISGTMLSVRKRQLKDRGSLVVNPKPRALRWDPDSSQFVF